MDRVITNMILYRPGGVVGKMAEIYRDWDGRRSDSGKVLSRVHKQVRRMVGLAVQHGFSGNLWHCCIALALATEENPFSLCCERRELPGGSLRALALHDMELFQALFTFDFSPLEQALGIDGLTVAQHYEADAAAVPDRFGSRLQTFAETLAAAAQPEQFLAVVADFYRRYGVGAFGLNQALQIRPDEDGVEFVPVTSTDRITFDDLIGYELQKKELIYNTEAFLQRKACNNVLLYGDAGTGKSSSVKALANRYYDDGLRLIEIHKYQFRELSGVIGAIRGRNYRFVVFIDDLSFEENEVEYKYLKAVIEGSAQSKPENVVIYATSNRRHLIKETWNDRNDMEFHGEIHRSDTMEEKLSLAGRFGVAINFSIPNRQQYHEIVTELAQRQLKTQMPREELLKLADRWEIRHGGVSGRTAQQFIHYLSGKE